MTRTTIPDLGRIELSHKRGTFCPHRSFLPPAAGTNRARAVLAAERREPCPSKFVCGKIAVNNLKRPFVVGSVVLLCLGLCAAQDPASQGFTRILGIDADISTVRLLPAKLDGVEGIVAQFRGSEDLHYYATSDSAPFPGFELKVIASSDQLAFGEPLFPQPADFRDPLSGERLDVFEGNFDVFIPFNGQPDPTKPLDVKVTVSGQACTHEACTPPTTKGLVLSFTPGPAAPWTTITADLTPRTGSTTGNG